MGGGFYSVESRNLRAETKGYDHVTTATMDSVFTQKKENKAHQDMLPENIKGVRESRDNKDHPKTLPIQFWLDVTGSMMDIPVEMIKTGLPTLISTLVQRGLPDVSLMFGAIGDHECDRYPLQLGQYEAGDAELDMWLERVYPEAGGGSNAGESYGLAWFQAGFLTETDAWDKRKEKGFVFTIGDEPSLINYPGSMLKQIYGSNCPQVNDNYTLSELYQKASERNHVFHIHVKHNPRRTSGSLGQLLGDSLLVIEDYREIPLLIADTIIKTLESSEKPNNLIEEVVVKNKVDKIVEEKEGNEDKITL